MAESGEELICPICQVEFEDAVIIQCHHSFCRHCITKWIKHNQSNAWGTFTCPVCKSVNETSDLQTSFHVEQMRELMSRRKTKESSYPECSDHLGEDLKVYCLDCDQPVCVNCIIETKHKDHTFRQVAEVADRMQTAIGRIIAEEKKTITIAEAKVDRLNIHISKINREERLAFENCYKRADELKSQVDNLAKLTVHDIEKRTKEKLRRPLENKLRCTRANIDDQKQYLKAVEKLYDANNENQVVKNYKEMLSIRRPHIKKEELVLSKYNVDNTCLFERSNGDLTDIIDPDLILGKVSTDRHYMQTKFNSPSSVTLPTPVFPDSSFRMDHSSGGVSMSPQVYRKSLFLSEHCTCYHEKDDENFDMTDKWKGTSMKDLRSKSLKNKLKRFFSKPFKD